MNDYVIKTMNLTHNNCIHQQKNKFIIVRWTENMYLEKIKVNLNMFATLIRQNIDEEYKVKISRVTAYNAKNIAKKMIIDDI